MKESDQKAAKKISFRQKEPTKCPVCSFEFFREEMLTGGGRLIAGKLTDELRRLYDKNEKFGKVYPMAYVLTVCPRCLYTAYPKDFGILTDEEKKKMQGTAQARINSVKKFFGDIDFREDRSLVLGAASYLLAVDCYSFRRKEVAPTFKNAMSSIRAAWLFGDLAREVPEKPYGKISQFFYKKSYAYYMQAIDLAQTGGETLEAAGHIGPDTDKNWSYEGLLYMCAILTVKVGAQEPDLAKRLESFEKTKRFLSRLFGVGKSSKSKPGALIDMTRDLYERMNAMIEEWNQQAGQPDQTE
ncbi:MAG TPA: DUF2225 domain-containing protein [Spirochaetota bacterium]|nr:DUF2225 domain-containing protein [Spirochaetota bacterium]HNT11262.1 DUF2225 domain-containing protein [Spirochaetota bacterium]HOS38649.1 DUF2225 domain-containing protein [Spirochaetota bacterium]HPU87509.1 DUF2225 domain-containing protein [Spirochaetota bacterium]